MKKTLVFFTLFIVMTALKAQDTYVFEVVKENVITPVKNQHNSGTCWSFSGVGMLEADLIRTGKGKFDLSEMYIVRRNYEDKAIKYARLHGHLNFTAGGSFADVVGTLDDYGIMPEEAYKGLNYGSEAHNHNELDKVLKGYMDGVIGADNLTSAWFSGFSSIMDAYLGEIPETFVYEGNEYTPHTFREFLGLKASDYVSLTSFNHHPFYINFAIEVPDNWRWSSSYNLPLDELMEVIDNAVMEGYTVAWASDVSEIGFSHYGVAIVPDDNDPENAGSDEERWLGQSKVERENQIQKRVGREILAEKVITQEMRQEAFDNYQTTDDHGMLIYGIARDQKGNTFYMVKNSWGDAGFYNGLWYASNPFVRYKTTSIVVHKDALPKNISDKLGL